METIKDLWASLVAYANERSTNPLTSAFFLTWAGWNYKFFVVLFNGETSAAKFAAIEALYPRTGTKCPLFDVLCPSPASWFFPPDAFWGGAFVYPALLTLFYVFAYPYLTSWVVTFYRRRQVEISNSLKKVEGERVRTVSEVTQMVRRFEKRVKDAEDETTSALQELADTRNALQAAELEVKKNTSFSTAGTGSVSDVGEIVNPAPVADPTQTEDDEALAHNTDASIRNTQRYAEEEDLQLWDEARKQNIPFGPAFRRRETPYTQGTAASVLTKAAHVFSDKEMRVIGYLNSFPSSERVSLNDLQENLGLNDAAMVSICRKLELLQMIEVVGSFIAISERGRSILAELKRQGEVPDGFA